MAKREHVVAVTQPSGKEKQTDGREQEHFLPNTDCGHTQCYEKKRIANRKHRAAPVSTFTHQVMTVSQTPCAGLVSRGHFKGNMVGFIVAV